MLYYRVIILILVNIAPSWDIEGRELQALALRYPNEVQYSPISVHLSSFSIPTWDCTVFTIISVITLLLYSYNFLFRFPGFLTFKMLF